MKAWQIAVLVVLAALIVTHWTAGWALLGLIFLARWAWNVRASRPFVIDELHRPLDPELVARVRRSSKSRLFLELFTGEPVEDYQARLLDRYERGRAWTGVDLASGPDLCVRTEHRSLTPEETADLRRRWENPATRGEFVDLPGGPGTRVVFGTAGEELTRGELVHLLGRQWVPAWKRDAERAYHARRGRLWRLLAWFAAGWWFVRRLLRRGR